MIVSEPLILIFSFQNIQGDCNDGATGNHSASNAVQVKAPRFPY